VEQFHDSGHFDGAPRGALSRRRIAVTQEQQRGPKPLSTPAEQVARDLRHGLESRGALARKFLLHLKQVFPHELKDFFDCQ
jgi:hypothetical protein